MGDSGFPISVPYVLIQLPIFLFILKQRTIRGTTLLVSWLASFSAFSRNISKKASLPLVEQWEQYVLANHSKFPPNADEELLPRMRAVAALNKIGSLYLKRDFPRETRRFLEEFTNSLLSTVAARSKIGKRWSCFCPATVIGGDVHVSFYLHHLLLDGLLEMGWVRCGEIEACWTE